MEDRLDELERLIDESDLGNAVQYRVMHLILEELRYLRGKLKDRPHDNE